MAAVALATGLGTVRLEAGEIITTPSGERVLLEHFILHAGIAADFYEYTDSTGTRVLHGVYKLIYPGGWIKRSMTYYHGVRDGPFAKWTNDAVKEVDGHYKAGVLHGEIRWYHDSGKVKSEEIFAEGELNGPYVWYYENGRVRERGAYKKGVLDGPYIEYHENGRVYLEGSYRNGQLQGVVRLYDQDGTARQEGVLEKDRIVGSWTCLMGRDSTGTRRDGCDGKLYFECACD
ncbi:MAG: toxin-antitoxin system YwqK family antitoxin [SAR324 cluster bacterium]|nr:toxin-antitoxin system YwqK family antitoxin [SAR324 cluster bacterium]